jgi:chitin synthase
MDSPYHRRPPSDPESDEEDHNPFDNGLDPAASSDRIPLTQSMTGRNLPPYSASPPIEGAPPYTGARPTSRYTLSESYLPAAATSSTNLGGGYGPASVHFPVPSGGRPLSVVSNYSEDWIQRQQPVAPAQADLRRYQTRRVRLTQGNVFSADYPYIHLQNR